MIPPAALVALASLFAFPLFSRCLRLGLGQAMRGTDFDDPPPSRCMASTIKRIITPSASATPTIKTGPASESKNRPTRCARV